MSVAREPRADSAPLAGRAAADSHKPPERRVAADAVAEAGAGGDDATVDLDVHAGDESRRIARQELDHLRDVVGLAGVRPRLDALHARVDVAAADLDERRPDHTRAHGVDADPLRRELGGGDPGEVDHGRLRRGVGLRSHAADGTRDRGDVDDRAALPLLEEHANGMLGAQKDTPDDDGERVVPVVDVELRQRAERTADAGVVDHAVEPSVRVARVRDRAGDVGLPRDVSGDEAQALAAELAHDAGAPVRVHVGQHNRPVRPEEALDGGAADPARPARDDRDPRHAQSASRSRSSSAIRSASGTHTRSSDGAYGTGVYGPPSLRTGASRSQNPSSAISAATSAPIPKSRTASWTTSARLVLATDARIVSRSSGTTDRRSITSMSIPSSASASPAASDSWTMRDAATTVTWLPSLATDAFPIGTRCSGSVGAGPVMPYSWRFSMNTTGFGSRIAARRSPYA